MINVEEKLNIKREFLKTPDEKKSFKITLGEVQRTVFKNDVQESIEKAKKMLLNELYGSTEETFQKIFNNIMKKELKPGFVLLFLITAYEFEIDDSQYIDVIKENGRSIDDLHDINWKFIQYFREFLYPVISNENKQTLH
jgi:hypothetical protein